MGLHSEFSGSSGGAPEDPEDGCHDGPSQEITILEKLGVLSLLTKLLLESTVGDT